MFSIALKDGVKCSLLYRNCYYGKNIFSQTRKLTEDSGLQYASKISQKKMTRKVC